MSLQADSTTCLWLIAMLLHCQADGPDIIVSNKFLLVKSSSTPLWHSSLPRIKWKARV